MGQAGELHGLVQEFGGLFGRTVSFWAQPDEPQLLTRVVDLGDVGHVWGHAPIRARAQGARLISGTGVGRDQDDSLLPALGEGLERYCACVFSKEQFITASAKELGVAALDLDSIPHCSNTELSHPNCPLLAPDKNEPIRWIQSISLLNGRQVYLPAIMVYLYAGVAGRGERFWLPITTGCAGHTSFERALLSAICEVVERDAISIVWLQKLPLPRIVVELPSSSLVCYWDLYQRASRDLEYVFFDATTDVGLPTVYGLQISRENPRLTTLVSCSTALQPTEAITKVMRDMAACRIAFRAPRPAPEHLDDCKDVFDGAAYMTGSERAHAFDFLLNGGQTLPLSAMESFDAVDDRHMLARVLDIFRSQKRDLYAVDLSTDEALRSGVRVVRVVIPSLQPFSFHYRARYLGHPRLYEAPRNLGYPVHNETELNQWPQPFA